jgi:cellulose synthase operon protein B
MGRVARIMEEKNMTPNVIKRLITARLAHFGVIVGLVATLFSPDIGLAQSASAATATIAPVAPIDVPQQRFVSLSLKQLGAWSAVKLQGGDSAKRLAFSIRSDEVVVAAKLTLAFDYSPALSPEFSHLKILLNDGLVGIEGLPKGKGVGASREIAVESRLIRDYNEITLNLIGSNAGECGGPSNPSLWLTIAENSRLDLTLAPRSAIPDLKYLPEPFVDRRENGQLNLPFVFSSSPSVGTLKAAGVVASWLGIHAGVRGAQFPVFLNELPKTNAVVFLNGSDEVAGYKAVPGAVVSVQPNPKNPGTQLLIVNGNTDADLQRAARAIALIHSSMSGKNISVNSDVEMAPRKAYDAPAWVRTDRPVKLGEIAKLEDLKVQGYSPETVRVNYRLPPDVFTWRSSGVPFQLKYRATLFPTHKYSNLSIALNNNFIDAIALNELPEGGLIPSGASLGSKKSVKQASLALPPYALGGRDQLQLGFSFDAIKLGECLPPNNLVASIDAESTLDFSDFPKYVALPNLAHFAQNGFPFTKFADLSQTNVVLPEKPAPEEISLYLSVMGKMGESTGYPAIRHGLINANQVSQAPDKDMIVIGSAQNQRLFSDWSSQLPMYVDNGLRKIREPNVSWRPTYRWEQQDIDETAKPKGSINLSGAGNLVTLMAFESPLKPTRSVVFLYSDKPSEFKKINDLLFDAERIPTVQGDFAVVNEKTLQHAKVSDTYYLGHLPWHNKVKWFLADHPILVAFMVLLLAVLTAAAAYRPLKFVRGKILGKGK